MAKSIGIGMSPERLKAFQNLNIKVTNRTILCLDGGGMRGILTIQLLKKLEEVSNLPCYKLFDMVAGTSTGGIIAGLITTGHSAVEIEEIYMDLVTKVFDKNILGDRFVNPPAFSKVNYRKLLKDNISDVTLQDACKSNDIDLMITAQDMSAAEATFFSCFKQDDGSYYGTYKNVLLRAVMEATMSAPTYFYPLERFVDGGTTTYNNPAMAAFKEAISYSRYDKNPQLSEYKISEITLFSFGTGISRQFIKPSQTINPKGIDIIFWLKWLMTQTGQDASAMQVDTFRSPIIKQSIDFRRFQISFDPASIKKIPNINSLNKHKYQSEWLWDLGEEVLGNIDMADINRFDLMKIIGEQMALFIMTSGNCFTKDLINNNNNDILVTTSGDISRIESQMSDPNWIDAFKA